LKHCMAKLIVCHYLLENGHFFKTEQKLNRNYCDVIDLNTFIVYEIETNPSDPIRVKKLDKFYHPLIEDIIIIDLKKMKHDWYELIKFSEQVKKHVVVDALF